MARKYYSMLFSGTLTMMVAAVLLMSDSFIAGVMLGSDAVAGITLVTPIYAFITFFGSLISIGIPIAYSTEMVKFNKSEADKTFGFGVLMSIIVGIITFLLISLFGDFYLGVYSASGEILSHAGEYMYWMRFIILILPLRMIIGDMVYSDGDEITSTISNLVQGVGNIILSIILCHIMGIQGISLASFIFNVIALLILLLHFLKKDNSLRWNLHFSFRIMKDILRYSIIDSSAYLFLAVLTFTLNVFICIRFGEEFLILSSVVALCREFQLLFDGICGAVGPIFSEYVVEKNHSGLRASYDLAKKTGIVEGITVTLILIIIAPVVAGILHITDPQIAGWAVTGVRIIALGSTFLCLLYLLTAYLLVIKKILLGVVVCALRDVVLSIGLVILFGNLFGITGMFIGLAAAPVAAYALVNIYIRLQYGKEDYPLLLSRDIVGNNTYLFNLYTDPEEIIDIKGRVKSILENHGIENPMVFRVTLLIEEMLMFIRQMNDNKAILAECAVSLCPEGVRIILKDEGVPLDMAEEVLSTRSLNAYTVSLYLQRADIDDHHLIVMGYNRSTVLVRFGHH